MCKSLGARTVGVRRDPSRGVESIDRMCAMEELDGQLPLADVVALTLPHSPQTSGLLNRTRLFGMKRDAILLNGGRGSAIDCLALAEALESGRLWGAGLDVTDPEPLPREHPLWRCANALITPHTAGGNHLPGIERRVAQIALDNLKRYLRGEPLHNRAV